MTEEVKGKNQQKLIYLILIIVLLALLIIIGVLYFNKKSDVESLTTEKEQIRGDLQSELDALLLQHDQVKLDYGILADSLMSKDSLIQANAQEIKQLLNYKWEYFQIKKKLDQLRVVAQGYVYQIDSLYTVNRELQEENVRIRESYMTERQRNIGLTQEKQKLTERVSEAAVLRAYNIQSSGIRYRGAREEETDRARRTDALRICFTIGENSLITPGQQELFIRIARPDNVILIYDESDEYTFTYLDNKLQYSLKQIIDYKGSTQDVCLNWRKRSTEEETMAGRYRVSIYANGNLIGESAFELR